MSASTPTHNYTQGATEGALYSFYKNADIADITKIVRKEIKRRWPNIKTSTRIERYAGGQSLDVEIKEVPFKVKSDLWQAYLDEDSNDTFSAWLERQGVSNYEATRLTEEAQELQNSIKHLVDSFNYNDCDGQIDYFNVNFYSQIEYSHEMTR